MPKVEKEIVVEDYKSLTLSQLKKEYAKLSEAYKKLKDGAYCHHCGKFLPKSSFYMDIHNASGLTNCCKACSFMAATNYDEKTKDVNVTKESIIEACKMLNKPFVENLYETGIAEVNNEASGKNKTNIWTSYIKNVQSLTQYYGMQYCDSDHLKYNEANIDEKEEKETSSTKNKSEEILEAYKNNKRDVIRTIGYDPFENYPIEEDKPILYAQLNSFIDEETKNDGMKMGAVIQIVKKLNQAEKLNDQIDLYISDTKNAANNMPLIDKMASSSQKLMAVANALAKDNGLSVNFNNNKSKGANTLSGKIKKLTEIGLRDAKINSFDIGTCEGMRQVAEISEAARHKQIGYDENIAQEIKDIKVELVEKLSKERDKAIEDYRKLLMENKDLKDFLLAKGLVNENYEVIDND